MPDQSRRRIGVIKPTRRSRPDFLTSRLERDLDVDVRNLEFRRGDRSTFETAFEDAEQLATELRGVGCVLVYVAGTPPFLLRGPAYEESWAETLSQRLGIPIVTPMTAHVRMLQEAGVRRALVASYYGPELVASIGSYLAQCAITPVLAPGFSLTGEAEGLYSTPLAALEQVSADQVVEYGKQIARSAVGAFDGVYVNGAGWDAEPAIAPLARALRVPVIWAQTAALRMVHRALGMERAAADPAG
jgi:maleate cis-trans isomerase